MQTQKPLSHFGQMITTPLYYVNAKPHLGHFYTTMLADVLVKNSLQRGKPTYFLTGTDEHGEKIEQMAKTQGKEPGQFVDEVSMEFRTTWERLGLRFDRFYRTTEPEHKRKVAHALQVLKDKGEIVFREYQGLYCVGCERFLTESELTAEGVCPDHRKPPEPRKESNYFFLMSKYQTQLIQALETNPNLVEPAHYRGEVLSFLKQPLADLCISRPKARLTWGIELPFDSNFVTYVWFDALLNYLCAAGWPDSFDENLWKHTTHLIAKDIVKTHAVYWPTILMALGVPLFKSIQASGYWLMSGAKMSKSLGNVRHPETLETFAGRDTLRFYLLREMSYGMDASFTLESYVQSVNAHLANGIGNLASRVLTLCQKNFRGEMSLKTLTPEDHEALKARATTLKLWDAGFSELKYQNALKAWCDLVALTDTYVNTNKPWALAKDPAQSDRLQTVLGVCLNLLIALATLIAPVLRDASQKLLEAIGASEGPTQTPSLPPLGALEVIQTQFKISSEVPKLFMRLQMPNEEPMQVV